MRNHIVIFNIGGNMLEKQIKKLTFRRYIFASYAESYDFTLTFFKKGTSKAKLDFPVKLENVFDIEQTKELIEEVNKLNLHKWKSVYEGEYIILDGEYWKLNIVYNDGTKEYKEGSGYFPKNYNKFIKLIRRLIDK